MHCDQPPGAAMRTKFDRWRKGVPYAWRQRDLPRFFQPVITEDFKPLRRVYREDAVADPRPGPDCEGRGRCADDRGERRSIASHPNRRPQAPRNLAEPLARLHKSPRRRSARPGRALALVQSGLLNRKSLIPPLGNRRGNPAISPFVKKLS